MHTKEEYEKFLSQACHALSIPLKKKTNQWELSIPKKFQTRFGHEKKIILPFHEWNPEGFVSKQLSLLLQQMNPVVSFAKSSDQTNKAVHTWFRISVEGFLKREKILHLCKKEEVIQVAEKEIEWGALLPYTENEEERKKIDMWYQSFVPYVDTEMETFFQEEQERAHAIIERETKRIETYFDTVKEEHFSSYTHTTYEDYGIINQERENLIKQQEIKYAIQKEQMRMTCLGILAIV